MPSPFCVFEENLQGRIRLPVADSQAIAAGEQLKFTGNTLTPVAAATDQPDFVGIAAEAKAALDGKTSLMVDVAGDDKVYRVDLSAGVAFNNGDPFTWAASGSFTKSTTLPFAVAAELQAGSVPTALVKFLLGRNNMHLRSELINSRRSVKAALAATGSVQGDAALLPADVNEVNASDGTKGVILPPVLPGVEIAVVNTIAAQALKVYPDTGGIIDYAAANAAYSLAGRKHAIFRKISSTQWYAFLTA